MEYQRIVIVGKSGAGKTTLAVKLADMLNATNVELDAIQWQANWVQLAKPLMRERADEALPVDGHWVADGNYLRSIREFTWGRADTLIWLDYPLRVALWRLLRRTIGRIVKRKELWNGNRETFRHHLNVSATENLFMWTVSMHKEHRRDFPISFEQPEYRHLKVLRFRNPKETERWLQELGKSKDITSQVDEQEVQPARTETTGIEIRS